MLEDKTHDLMLGMNGLMPLIVNNALSVLGAIVILLIGLWVSGMADRMIGRMLSRAPHFDPMLQGFFGSLARYLVLTVTVLAVLSQFGIQTTSLVAVLGAAGLAVGLALQGTLSNLAAGVMLLIFRPFRIGHKVQIGGNSGTVKVLSLFWTELVSDDKVQIIVPNGGVWGQALRNYSVYPTPARAGELRFRVPEGVNFEHATEIVGAAVEAEARLLTDPGPKVLLDHAADNAIEIIVTFATEDDAALVRSDLIKAVHGAFEADDAPSRQDGREQPAIPPPRTLAARWG